MATNWTSVLTLALVFIIISAPFTYGVTNKVFGNLGLRTATMSGAPTKFGLVLHSAVFVLVLSLVNRFR